MPFTKRIEQDDTEGNMPLRKNVEQGEPETDDSEGQAFKMKVEQGEPETDDTEGNRIKLIKGQG